MKLLIKKSLFASTIILSFALMQGCASGPGTSELLSSYSQYKKGQDKTQFCKSHPLPGLRIQDCVNNLVVYERSTVLCKQSKSDPHCLRRQQNKWSYEKLMSKITIETVTGKDINYAEFDKLMYKKAKTFPITCIFVYGLARCKEK